VQSTQSKIPELQRVILATQDRIVMSESFERALDTLFGQGTAPTQPPPGTPPVQPPPTSTSIAQLVKDASTHYQQAQDALKRGDFAEYGRLITLLQDDLAKLRTATGQ